MVGPASFNAAMALYRNGLTLTGCKGFPRACAKGIQEPELPYSGVGLTTDALFNLNLQLSQIFKDRGCQAAITIIADF
jgi:hypothetical protein